MKRLPYLFFALASANSDFYTQELNFRVLRQVDGSGNFETFVQNIRVTVPAFSCRVNAQGVKTPPFTAAEARSKIEQWWPFDNRDIKKVNVRNVRCGSLIIDFDVEQTSTENEIVDVIEALSTDFDTFTSFVVDGLNITDTSLEDGVVGDHEREEEVAIWTQTDSDPTTSWDPSEDNYPSLGPDVTLPMPFKPPSCEKNDANSTESTTLTNKIIKDLGSLIYNDIYAKGDCYHLIRERIYGSLQLSDGLMKNGPKFLDVFDSLNSDPSARDAYGLEVRTFFRDSFDDCDTTSCVVETFCSSLMLDTTALSPLATTSDGFKDTLVATCLNDGWRFQDILKNQNLNSCRFNGVIPSLWGYASCDSQNN